MSTPRAFEILMAEDSPTDRLIAIDALKEAGIANNLNVVENGIEAMAYLRREGKYSAATRPDLILLDLNLPKKDGREVLLEVKNDPALKFIPVVVLTTSDAEDDVVSSYGHHANSLIRKPIDFPRFAEIVRSVGGYWFQTVTLPTDEAIRRAMRGEVRSSAVPAVKVGQDVRVLLVEDDPASVLIVRDLLRDSSMASFHVESVSRLQDLRNRRDLSSFDVVLADLGLPDSQGLETYHQVRSCVAGRPIIVLTGFDDETTGLNALRAGAQDYLIKSELTSRTLARAVRYAIDKKAIETQLRQSQRLEAVGQLAAGIAHDFNNILTVVHGQAQLLKESGTLAPEATAAVAEIVESAERAVNLTRQLLTFSRQQVMHARGIALNTIVGGVDRLLRRLLGADVAVELELTADATVVDADVSMLEQVLLNLAVNARDAMPGGGKLKLATAAVSVDRTEVMTAEEYPGRFVKLTVSDTGSGVAPEVVPHIFEPFFTTKDVGKGTGLGLATVYSIVQQHRGWIRVFTKLGEGTRFEIFLPASSAPVAAVERPAPIRVEGTATILLVEDEPAVRRLAHQALARAGYRILSAATGVEALALWEAHSDEVDLLFTDMVMPDGMSGQQLATTLGQRQPRLKVVFTSGYSPDLVAGTSLREGFDFLQKPYSLADLLATIAARLAPAERPGPTTVSANAEQ